MAHKKGVGSTDNGRDSISKRLGVKLFGGEIALAGNIIVRQRGTKYHPGLNVYMGKDHTLHARVDGEVYFTKKAKNRTVVNIAPITLVDEVVDTPKPTPKAKKEVPAVVETTPVEETPVAAKAADDKITLPSGKKLIKDDLKMVEGIGPKIEGLLNDAGIHTWKDLADASEEKVQSILNDAGPRYTIHQPRTWAKQAELADQGKWELLEKYQDWLIGGKEPEGETFSFEEE